MVLRSETTGRGRSVLLAVLVCAGFLVVVAAEPAAAETATVTDRRGDVWDAQYDDDSRLQGWSRAGSVTNIDLLSTQVQHRARRIVVISTFADLRKRSDVLFGSLRQTLRTDTAPDAVASIRFGTGYRRPQGQLDLSETESGTAVECPTLTHRIDYVADTMTVVVPRGCLGSPTTVKLNSVVSGEHGSLQLYQDVFDGPGHSEGGYTRALASGG